MIMTLSNILKVRGVSSDKCDFERHNALRMASVWLSINASSGSHIRLRYFPDIVYGFLFNF